MVLQRLDIRGKIKVLHGQNKKTEEAPLALFCLCTPFGPPSLLEIPHKEVMFKSKHKLDLGFVSMDHRGKEMLQYDDEEMSDIGGYDLVHHDDLAYVASAHQERKFEAFKSPNDILNRVFFSVKDGCQWYDCLSLTNERSKMAVVTNVLKISVQEFQTRLYYFHASAIDVS